MRPTTRLSSPLSRERTGAGVTLTRLNLRLLEHCLPGERTNLPRKGPFSNIPLRT